MRSWINSKPSLEEDYPKPASSLTNGVLRNATTTLEQQAIPSSAQLAEQLAAELRQLAAALAAGREQLKAELDLLRQELGRPHPEKGILHKAVAIIRHKVAEQGAIVLSPTGWTLLARLDELFVLLPEDESEERPTITHAQ